MTNPEYKRDYERIRLRAESVVALRQEAALRAPLRWESEKAMCEWIYAPMRLVDAWYRRVVVTEHRYADDLFRPGRRDGTLHIVAYVSDRDGSIRCETVPIGAHWGIQDAMDYASDDIKRRNPGGIVLRFPMVLDDKWNVVYSFDLQHKLVIGPGARTP